ncbi:hypothetical protein MON38_21985 [Hymenobacter sp. DH14]|uniref:Tail fiber protein n=1 Tax=Hymenobacter cyanobacteriorum TaxID=2926463 RepID=A0A9X2AKU4_9BACT|nr:hypothetical protein [Hymenobacter cyanobacteriorum]MCI1190104.1 hypothetical protein [Hymenobacter cyanobacteriorum]
MLTKYLLAPLAALLLAAPRLAHAQTGSVGIGTTTPAASAALDITSTSKGLLLPRLTLAQRTALTASTTAPPVAGLVIYQTDNTPGLYAYDGAAWVRLGADNLGNHTATQTLNLNAQRLRGEVSTSLGDSTAQVELNASVGTQSSALITRSNFTNRYTRTILSGYGKLPEGTNSANDFGIWATAYRGGGWAGFFSAGSTTGTPLRWVGICQNPGFTNTGSAIRIVDGTQGAGKVLTSDSQGYGTWQTPTASPTAAGGNFDLGSYYLVGNGGSTGIAITSSGRVGIGTTAAAPATQALDVRGNVRLGNDASGGTGAGPAVEWVGPGINTDPVGLYRVNPANDQSELRVVVGDVADANDKFAVGRMAGTSTEGGIPAGTFTPNFTVRADGNVGIGTGAPTSTLQVAGSVAASIRELSGGSIAETDYTVIVTGSVSLPAPDATNTGRIYHLINGNTNTYTVTGTFRDAGSGGRIGSFTLNSTAGTKGITVQSDGSQWWILTRE